MARPGGALVCMARMDEATASRFYRLARYAASKHCEAGLRDDVVQDCMLAALEAYDRLHDQPDGLIANFMSWRAIDSVRRFVGIRRKDGYEPHPVRAATPLSAMTVDGWQPEFAGPDDHPSWSYSVDQVDGLTGRTKAMIVALAAGWTLAEVGAMWGVSESRVCQIRAAVARTAERFTDGG